MGTLANRFREQVLKSKDPRMEEGVFDVMYPTGFLPFDFLNGYRVHVTQPNGESYYYNSVGIVDGSSNMFIGRPACGKTTIAIQMAANIIRPFPNAVMFYDDIEGGSNDVRRVMLSKFTPEEAQSRIIYRNVSVTAENFYERINMIYEEKLSHKDDYEYDTGLLDMRGNHIYKLEPTVYILDSLAMLAPEKLTEEEKLSGQMSTTATAKTNTSIFKRIVPKFKAANIILLVINHINDKVEINPFSHSKAQIGYLKQDETLPGGKAALYLANNMIRVDDGAKLKASEGLGIDGKIVDFAIVKSRTNSSGKSVPMVFNAATGFDDILSLFMFLKSYGAVDTKGATCTLKGYPDIKFTQRNFKEKLFSDPEFAKAFNKVARETLETLLITPEDEPMNRPEFDSSSIINSILSLNQ